MTPELQLARAGIGATHVSQKNDALMEIVGLGGEVYIINFVIEVRPLQFNLLFLGLASPQDRVGRPACK